MFWSAFYLPLQTVGFVLLLCWLVAVFAPSALSALSSLLLSVTPVALSPLALSGLFVFIECDRLQSVEMYRLKLPCICLGTLFIWLIAFLLQLLLYVRL